MNEASPVNDRNSTTVGHEWWRGAVLYQIYPRSFRDTKGDGIGDLRGIVEGLNHIASLGVDGVWISPFFTSPMDDYGYDVSDYCGIDPSYGDFEDFDRIIEKAHSLGLKVIIDQVYSHTSIEHAWFEESRQDRTNPKADWYVWADAKPDGSPPSNWQSVFGGSAWHWDGPRKQYYLHNFLTSQPDLNVHNEEVQEALLNVARFWLDRGVDGFRLDAINFAMHDPQLRDNPAADVPIGRVTRPFDMQLKKFNQSHPEIVRFLERVRSLLDEYPGQFTVAEVGGPEPLDEMKAYTAKAKRLDSAYNFDFLYAERLSADLVRRSIGQWSGERGEGWPSWAFSNHDAPRAITRWSTEENRDQVGRLMLLLLGALRGNGFIYQGEELGLPQAEVAFEDLKDPEAIANWPHTLGRDGARTPLPWEANARNGGFTAGDDAWLRFDEAHHRFAINVQDADPSSMLNYTRRLLKHRRDLEALIVGDVSLIDTPDEIVAFVRRSGTSSILCAFNLSDSSVDWQPPMEVASLEVVATQIDPQTTARAPVTLPPMTGYWAVISENSD